MLRRPGQGNYVRMASAERACNDDESGRSPLKDRQQHFAEMLVHTKAGGRGLAAGRAKSSCLHFLKRNMQAQRQLHRVRTQDECDCKSQKCPGSPQQNNPERQQHKHHCVPLHAHYLHLPRLPRCPAIQQIIYIMRNKHGSAVLQPGKTRHATAEQLRPLPALISACRTLSNPVQG